MFYALLLVVMVVILNSPTTQLIVQRSMRDFDSKRSPGFFSSLPFGWQRRSVEHDARLAQRDYACRA